MDQRIDPRIALADQYPGYDISELDHLIEDEGLLAEYNPVRMRVLFETPSGFAIFGIDSGYLYEVGSDYRGIEAIWVNCVDKESADLFVWLRRFLKLDKSTAICPTDIDDSLLELIEEQCDRGEKLIVGELAYKEVIESRTEITCICDEAANELMWGLQNLMHVLVPEEESKFSKEDRKYHSKKLLGYLRDSVPNLDIKPETINGTIALLASFMRRCDVACKEYADSLRSVDYLMQRSGLSTKNWDIVTHATALMKLIGESVVMPDKMFTDEERKKINDQAGKYKDEIITANMQTVYKKVVRLNQLKFQKRDELMIVLQNAEAASRGKRSCQEAEVHGQRKKLKVDDDVDMTLSGATMD